MKAMVFAAGRGTRLGALTAQRPKALVEVGGLTLLETVLRRLRDAGVREAIINVHHCAEQIETFVEQHDCFGLALQFSREDELLDTGGGLKRAAWFFDDRRPFIAHNVDVLSDIDLGAVMRAHLASGALATLVAMTRPTARPLLFDEQGNLCGRATSTTAQTLARDPVGAVTPLGFCGIHVIAPPLLERLTENGAFSIIDSYLRLVREGADIRVFRAEGSRWRDAGRPEDLRPL